jgi:predicted dehydrogenase
MAQKLRAGIIGCGKIAINHAKTLDAFEDASLVAVCDTDMPRARAFAREYGIPEAYSDPAKFFSEQRLDVVHVCTPHPSHEELVVQAAKAGVHILCEKPLAISLASADRMIDAAADHDVQLGTVFQRRYWPAARRIREAIDGGVLGVPLVGECLVQIKKDRAYFEEDAWRGKWDTDGGGVLMNQAIHYIDLLQWYMGSARRVTGKIATLRHGEYIEVEDTAVATIEFDSGALATVRATTAADPNLGYRVALTGSSGATVSLTEFPVGNPGVNDVWAVQGSEEYTQPWAADINSTPAQSKVHEDLQPFHALQVRDFLQSISQGTKPEIDGVEGRKSLAIIQAIYESSRTGSAVLLPVAR